MILFKEFCLFTKYRMMAALVQDEKIGRFKWVKKISKTQQASSETCAATYMLIELHFNFGPLFTYNITEPATISSYLK